MFPRDSVGDKIIHAWQGRTNISLKYKGNKFSFQTDLPVEENIMNTHRTNKIKGIHGPPIHTPILLQLSSEADLIGYFRG